MLLGEPVTSKPTTRLQKAEDRLREIAIAFPEVYEEFPWGHRAMKVRKKAFAFIALDEEGLSLSVKLPASGVMALALPFASPTGYGLGRSGWVTSRRRKRSLERKPLPTSQNRRRSRGPTAPTSALRKRSSGEQSRGRSFSTATSSLLPPF